MKFKLESSFLPKGDQKSAIDKLYQNIQVHNNQILLGATGTGKTFTIANLIQKYNKPTLVIVHNKTLALQLYEEFKAFFPNNKVEYFVSLFDFFSPEAYIVKNNTYVDKSSKTNLEIALMRRSAQNALLSRNDTIVVASVAAIYGIDNPKTYKDSFTLIQKNQIISRKSLIEKLVQNGYTRNPVQNSPSTFVVRGNYIRITPSWTIDYFIEINLLDNIVEEISKLESLSFDLIEKLNEVVIFPGGNYITSKDTIKKAISKIEKELVSRRKYFKETNKLIELQRITERVNQDLESLKEFKYCSGIENYSAIFDNRSTNETPFTLLDYFSEGFLTIIDESHMTIPQIKGMYFGDYARKKNLVDYGFRLPSALDNRPLKFNEFENKLSKTIFVSATPGEYETNKHQIVVEQIIRPTGLIDPSIEIVPSKNQILDLISKIKQCKLKNQRVFITTLTIAMSEDLTSFLQDKKFQVAYLHNKLKTFERTRILNDLRRGIYDIVVGVNLLREGLDIPEVSLIAIMDADKSGFLRDARSLIQTIGRAARNIDGKVVMYADDITPSIANAIKETERRRKIQRDYNIKNNITPKTIIKKIPMTKDFETITKTFLKIKNTTSKTKEEIKTQMILDLKNKMICESKKLNFEKAAKYRDMIVEVKSMK